MSGPGDGPAHAAVRGKCHTQPMRFFNTAGPVRPDDHYTIPPLDRMDVDELLALIRAKQYFVLHAPRQTGKTSALIALRDLLNSGEGGAPGHDHHAVVGHHHVAGVDQLPGADDRHVHAA